MQVNSLMSQYKNLDKSVLDAGKSFLNGESNLDEFTKTAKSASSSTAKFNATLKSVAANIGIMLAITLAIKAVQYAWDKFNTTVAEAQANLDETQSTITSLKTQIEELEKIEDNALTQGQKDKLENLKEQLAVQQQLEEIEKRRLAREKVGSGNFADYFDKDSYANASLKIQGNIDDYFYGKKIITRDYNNASDEVNRLSSLLEFERSHNADSDTLKYTEDQLQKSIEEQRKSQERIVSLQNDLISQKAEVQSWLAEIQGYIDDGSLVGTDLTDAQNKIETLNGQLETINEELEYTNILLYGGDDSWENVLAQKTKYSLDNLLGNGFTEDELQILATLSFDKNASLNELRTILDEAQNMTEDSVNESTISLSDVFSLKDAENEATILSELNDKLSEVKSAYETCLSAKEEYDEQGYLSVDTLQKVISLGDDYLQYLFDEQGNVKLDAEAFKQLTLARINDMEAQALQNLAENIKQITDEATATEYLAQKQNELASSYTDVAINALLAMQQISGFSNSDALQGAYNSFKTQYEQIKSLFANTRSGLDKEFNGISDSAKKAVEDAEQATKEYIDSYMDYMEKSLESGRVDYQTYSRDVANFLKNMYDQGKIAAKDYHDYSKQMLEVQKSAMDGVISAVTYRIDKEIDAIKSQQDAIQDTIDKLREENDEKERAIELEKARYELARAQAQRTVKLYSGTDKGFIYSNDNKAVRDAQENLSNLEFEEIIKGLEKEKDALNDSIDELEKYKDKWNDIAKQHEIKINEMYANSILGANWESDILSGRIDVLNSFADNYIAIQQAIADAAWASANEQIRAAKEAEKAASGNTGGSEPIVSIIKLSSQSDWYDPITKKSGIGKPPTNTGHNIMMKYGTGTDNAKPGIHKIGENGEEIVRTNDGNAFVTNGETMYPFEGGEIVVKASETAKILENLKNLTPLHDYASKITTIDYSSMVMSNLNSTDFSKLAMNKGNSTTISIGDIHLHEVQNVPDFAKALQKHLPNISVQYNGKH